LRTAQRHLAIAQQRENEARIDLLRDTISDEVKNASRALATKRRALDASTRSAELSREALRLVRVQYESGKATQLDLLQAQDSLVAANVGLAQARFALSLADLQLKRAAGTFPKATAEP
jgi:outer membrane protein TolC